MQRQVVVCKIPISWVPYKFTYECDVRPPVIRASSRWYKQSTEWQCGKDIPWVAQTIKLRRGSCSAGFHMEPQGVHLLSKCRFKDALLNCMQNSSEKPTSRTKQLQAVQKLMAHNKQLTLQFATDMWTEILEHDNSIHTVFTDEAKFTSQDMSVNITVSFEVVSNQENIKDMNGIVLKWDTGPSFIDEDIITSNSFLHLSENYVLPQLSSKHNPTIL